MSDGLKCMLMKRCMRWLGHVCRMDATRQPHKLLFGELMKSWPFHGTKQHWRDVTADLKTLDIPLNDWYDLTMIRQEWYKRCVRGCLEVMDTRHPSVQCFTGNFNCGCGCSFHHQGDLTRHMNYCDGQPKVAALHFECSCGWVFRRLNDLMRHSKYCK